MVSAGGEPPHRKTQAHLKRAALASGKWLGKGLFDKLSKDASSAIWGVIFTLLAGGSWSADTFFDAFGRKKPPPPISQPRELPKAMAPAKEPITTTGSLPDKPKISTPNTATPTAKAAVKKSKVAEPACETPYLLERVFPDAFCKKTDPPTKSKAVR